MARSQESLHAVVRRLQDRRDYRWYHNMRTQYKKVVQVQLLRLIECRCICRGSCLETNCEKYYFLVRVCLGNSNCIQWRIEYSDITTARLHIQEIVFAPRNSQHIAEGAKDHVRMIGDANCLVDHFYRGHTNRTTGTVNELYIL